MDAIDWLNTTPTLEQIRSDIKTELFERNQSDLSLSSLSETSSLNHQPVLSSSVNGGGEDLTIEEFTKEFNSIYALLENQNKILLQHHYHLTDIMQQLTKYQKKVMKKLKKKKNNAVQRGIQKPCNVSIQLCNFLNCSIDTKISRTVVTKRIHEYIKEHNLSCNEDKKYFCCDQALSLLFNVAEAEKLKYFSVQKLINPHFLKGQNEDPAEMIII